VQSEGRPPQIVLRVRNSQGEWRHLDAHVSDLRNDRHVRGIVLNARDITERVRLEQELTAQAQRDTFGTHLIEALEMADEEATTFDVVERAMVEISPSSPMELLLSDSSRAHLERAATSPTSGAPACPVQSPFSCVAVRRGNPVVFDTSESLNACPKPRDRPGGACSAVCVPVSFMGRALGVLHATGPVGAPPGSSQVTQLTTLATQAGARIGTVRAFQRTQLQASTDGLTGLVNRRTLETKLRGLIKHGRPFALAIADLDHFKQLNDAHGHEAGDRALRVFAKTAQDVLRDDDVIARWGGEEFVIVVPDLDRHQAVSVLERIRERLAAATGGDHPAFTASFGLTDSTRADGLEHLLQLADAALYNAKEAGRDRIAISDATRDKTKGPVLLEEDGDGTLMGRHTDPASSLHTATDEEDPQPQRLRNPLTFYPASARGGLIRSYAPAGIAQRHPVRSSALAVSRLAARSEADCCRDHLHATPAEGCLKVDVSGDARGTPGRARSTRARRSRRSAPGAPGRASLGASVESARGRLPSRPSSRPGQPTR
ncbi:MAG: diguanylate cyclase, partial [Actinomycetota bacterium]|nr:diguanylate cyclase [Actinomycetota bacterium]